MNFIGLVKDYLKALKTEFENAEKSNAATPELSFRGSLDNFFKNLAQNVNPNIAVIPEPKNQGRKGRPDWRFHDNATMGVYGYVEAKGLDPNNPIDIQAYRPQVDKYLDLGHRVILTDGVDFVLFIPKDPNPVTFSVTPKPINWQTLEATGQAESMFRQFFDEPGYRHVNEEQLIEEIAKRARLLAADIELLVTLEADEARDEQEARTINSLKKLKQIVETQHDRSLQSISIFSDFVAQVLSFGLLYAHRVVRGEEDKPADRYFKIQEFWSGILHQDYAKRLAPFRELITQLNDELDGSLSQLGTWYDDGRRLLAYVQLTNQQRSAPDYHTLYERFLSIYDPETRFDYGAFYTPSFLAAYTVNLSEAVAKIELGENTLYSEDTKIIDPCCGTGTFLEELVNRYTDGSHPNTIGFEILPAPYALAHYRMTMIKAGYPQNLQIVLTNTLSDALEQDVQAQTNDSETLIEVEQRKARELCKPPLTVVIGNPPSSDSSVSSSQEGKRIQDLLEDFRPPKEDRKQRQNTQKQTNNEFLKFLRWACDKLVQSRPAILAFVLPSSFARHPSYQFARKWICNNFSKIWILQFDSDNRTGAGSANLFKTLQGRLLLVGITHQNPAETSCRIFHHSITQLSRDEKKQYLTGDYASDELLGHFQEIPLDTEVYSFQPVKNYDKQLYSRFWPICADDRRENENYIFERHISGIKLAPTHLLFHVEEGMLRRRSRVIGNRAKSYAEIKREWYEGMTRPPSQDKITDRVRELLVQAVSNGKIVRYSYRPFIEAKVIMDNALLAELESLGGGGTRSRPELRSAYSDEDTIGIAIAPGPQDIGERLHRFVSFCTNLPDNDIVSRGNGHIFCNLFPEYKPTRGIWNQNPKPNINSVLLKSISDKLGLTEIEAGHSIVFYSYALLCSEVFLEKFEGALFTPAGGYPRIPIVVDAEIFRQIAEFGRRLADLEQSQTPITPCEFADKYDHMFPGEFKLKDVNFDTAKGWIDFVGEGGQVVIRLTEVAKEIIGFQVCGYDVLKEWVKVHSFTYLRSSFRREHFEKFLHILCAIQAQISLIGEMDVIVENMLDGSLALVEP